MPPMTVPVGVVRALPRVSASVPLRARLVLSSTSSSSSFGRLRLSSSSSSSTPTARRTFHVQSRSTAAPVPTRSARMAASNGGSSSSSNDAAAAPAEPALVGVSPDPMPEAPLAAAPTTTTTTTEPIDWSSSFHGLSTLPFDREATKILLAPIDPNDIEIKPDGILYLPEIKYRRILNLAFGPGGWGLAPRGELAVGDKVVTREYALVVHGRFVGQARGECPFFNGADGVATAGEGCKSNALMRCCKDLGIASELWDPRFIRDFKKSHCREIWVEHVATKKRRQIWLRKDCPPAYPYVATTGYAAKPAASSSGASR